MRQPVLGEVPAHPRAVEKVLVVPRHPEAALVAKAEAAALAAEAERLWSATANPEGPGVLERGHESQPRLAQDFDPLVVQAVVRLARLADSASESLRDHPNREVRRSAAILAARAHPIRAAFDA